MDSPSTLAWRESVEKANGFPLHLGLGRKFRTNGCPLHLGLERKCRKKLGIPPPPWPGEKVWKKHTDSPSTLAWRESVEKTHGFPPTLAWRESVDKTHGFPLHLDTRPTNSAPQPRFLFLPIVPSISFPKKSFRAEHFLSQEVLPSQPRPHQTNQKHTNTQPLGPTMCPAHCGGHTGTEQLDRTPRGAYGTKCSSKTPF